tara:strand:- start:2 stop:622 length:621 start_codon:yes stop_codon:yes gene_type:complete
MSKPYIITFEGIDGSGKTTHIKKIEKHLAKNKIKYLSFREPGGTKTSEKIRKLILNNKNNFSSLTDLLLYMASRNENMKIIQKNKKVKIILIDRFIHSSLAYQHYGMGIKYHVINFLNKLILKKIKIDCTFLMIVNKNNLARRFNERKKLNRYDKFKFSFYKKVQDGYMKLSKMRNNNFIIINSNENIKINQQIIIKKINSIVNIK